MARLLKTLLLLSCLAYTQSSLALAKLGHQLVCQLAFNNLTAPQQLHINQLLALIPPKEQQNINRYNHAKKHSPITFARACTWADAIKNAPDYQAYRTWHYMNLARDIPNVIENSCTENCLPQAILHHQQQLKSLQLSWQKSQALLFLGHWLGDIHQPLHVSYASDLGGNKVSIKDPTLVNQQERCTNLHWYWDNCIMSKAQRSNAQWLMLLQARWTELDEPEYHAEQVWRWADESYQVIRQPSFGYCEIKDEPINQKHSNRKYVRNNTAQKNSQNSQSSSDNKPCLRPTQEVVLADNYQQQHLPIMEQQLLKAAKRLQQILNASL